MTQLAKIIDHTPPKRKKDRVLPQVVICLLSCKGVTKQPMTREAG